MQEQNISLKIQDKTSDKIYISDKYKRTNPSQRKESEFLVRPL